MNDPRLLSLFITIFVLLGGYNVYTGLKRLREARARGQSLTWYKQINLLTGIEYLLLSFVFTISLNIRNNNFPSSLKGLMGFGELGPRLFQMSPASVWEFSPPISNFTRSLAFMMPSSTMSVTTF